MFRSKHGKFFVLLITASISLSLLIVGALVYLKLSIHGKFPPKTYVAGIEISGKTFDEALGLLRTKEKEFIKKDLSLTFQDKTASVKIADLNINFLTAETLNTIQETDARNFGLFDLIFPKNYEEKNTTLLTSFDLEKTWITFDQLFQLSVLEPLSANFYLNERGQLQISEEKAGLLVDKNKLFQDLKFSLGNLEPKTVAIVAQNAEPKVTVAMLEGQKDLVLQKLQHRLTLVDPIYSDDWQIRLKDHLDWITFTTRETLAVPLFNKPEYVLGSGNTAFIQIKPQELDKYIDENLSKWLDKDPENVNIVQKEDGEVEISGKGADGKKVQRENLRKSIELAIDNMVEEITIPVATITPKLTVDPKLEALGIHERVSIGHTSYYGSPGPRVYNINVAAQKLNGTLIAPGEEFSFNTTIGPVDGSTGYVKELVIKKEGTIPEFGGGVCQVSTTVYRSALFAGLPITERNEHSYAVSYYSQILGHGLDATIYIGGPDLRFVNDTGHHLLMQTYTDPEMELYIVLYGTNDGRSVEMEGPYISNKRGAPPTIYVETSELEPGQTKQSDKPHPGFDVLWYRYLTDKDGKTLAETISTHYKAMPAKIMVGAPLPEEAPETVTE